MCSVYGLLGKYYKLSLCTYYIYIYIYIHTHRYASNCSRVGIVSGLGFSFEVGVRVKTINVVSDCVMAEDVVLLCVAEEVGE